MPGAMDTPPGYRAVNGTSGGGDRPWGPSRELVLATLEAELDPTLGAAELLPAIAGFFSQQVEPLVGVHGVVMEEDGALGRSAMREGDGVGEGGVAPADVLRVLGVGVLAVVDQQRGFAGQLE